MNPRTFWLRMLVMMVQGSVVLVPSLAASYHMEELFKLVYFFLQCSPLRCMPGGRLVIIGLRIQRFFILIRVSLMSLLLLLLDDLFLQKLIEHTCHLGDIED